MPIFHILVNWEVSGIKHIEALNIEEAIKIAEDETLPYPRITDNSEGSLEVNFEIIESLNPGVKIKDEGFKGIFDLILGKSVSGKRPCDK